MKKAAVKRPGVLFDGYQALFKRKYLPQVLGLSIIKPKALCLFKGVPDTNDTVIAVIVDTPGNCHKIISKLQLREKPLLSGLCEFNCVFRYKGQ